MKLTRKYILSRKLRQTGKRNSTRKQKAYKPIYITGLILILCTIGLLFSGSAVGAIAEPVPATPHDKIMRAWELAQQSGTYSYRSQIEQTTYPSPTVTNAGRPARKDTLSLEGSLDQTAETMEMTIWQDGSFDPNTGVAVRVEDGQAYGRQGQNTWLPLESNVAEGFAPGGDPLAFLIGMKNVAESGVETREFAGSDEALQLTGYTFELDGVPLAAHMRDILEAELQQRGELPVGMNLGTSDQYLYATGTGEIWLTADGLPYRLTLDILFPTQDNGERVRAEIGHDFFGFDKERIEQLSITPTDNFQVWLMAHSEVAAQNFNGYQAGVATMAVLLLIIATYLLARYGHTKIFYRAVVGLYIVSSLVGPLLHATDTHAFAETHRDRMATQQENEAEAELEEAAYRAQTESGWNPNANPLSVMAAPTAEQQAQLETLANYSPSAVVPALTATSTVTQTTDTDGDGLNDAAEAKWGTCASASSNAAACRNVADSTDSDGDTLSDGVEVNQLGTSPTSIDTDGDLISDTLEIQGFFYQGRQWYLDPTAVDSNKDGLPDSAECSAWVNVSVTIDTTTTYCQDTDNDGTPDVFDRDNDGDGVEDIIDLSPFSKGSSTYNDTTPFKLAINNLTTNNSTIVNLQFRTVDAVHLSMAGNVLDWPTGDVDGNIQRRLNTTFATTISTTLRSNDFRASYGDIRLMPLLEVTMPNTAGHYANLAPLNSAPATRTPNAAVDTWLDKTEYDLYGISVGDQGNNGDLIAYVPLRSVSSPQGDTTKAYEATMYYEPSQSSWGAAHEYRVIWLVQMLTDECDPTIANNSDETTCTRRDTLKTIHLYPESWNLTGFSITESQGLEAAVLYENPAQDTDPTLDDELWRVSWNLSNTWLVGRDCGNGDPGVGSTGCTPDGDSDVTIKGDNNDDTVAVAVSEWTTGNNDITVGEITTQPHGDHFTIAMSNYISNTVLGGTFANFTTRKPTFLYLQERTGKDINFDESSRWSQSGDQLTFNFSGVPSQTHHRMNWASYHYVNGEWQPRLNGHLDDLKTAVLQDTDFFTNSDTPEQIEGKQVWAQIYYLTIYSGLDAIAQLNGNPASNPNDALSEIVYGRKTDIDGSLRGIGSVGTVFLRSIFVANGATSSIQFLRWESFTSMWQQASGAATFGSNVVTEGFTTLNTVTSGTVGFFMVVFVAALLVLVVAELFGSPEVAKVAKLTLKAAGGGLTALKLASTLYRSISLMQKSSAILTGFRAAGIAGIIVGLLVTWGLFAYIVATGDLDKIQLHALIAGSIAASIVLIILAVLSFVSIVTLVIVLLLALVDLILFFVGEKGITARITEELSKAIYDVDTVIDNMSDPNRLSINTSAALADNRAGFSIGNSVNYTFTVGTLLEHTTKPSSRVNQAVFVYHAQTTKQDQHANLSLGQMANQWQVLQESRCVSFSTYPFYKCHKFSPTKISNQSILNHSIRFAGSGLNQNSPLFITEAFLVPWEGCWLGFIDCTTNSEAGSTHIDLTQSFDVLPTHLWQFAQWDWLNHELSYRFDHPDLDNDGWLAQAGDPDDTLVDTDWDGLSDSMELAEGTNPQSLDTDGDGLYDLDELVWGTSPTQADTDGDGLSDHKEVIEGWLINYNGTAVTRIWSDPNKIDTDGDGLTDLIESDFGFNPNVATDQSIIQDLISVDRLEIDEVGTPSLALQFDEALLATSFADYSGSGHSAQCDTNCPLAGQNGRYGYAPSFDGVNDYLLVDDDAALRIDNNFTVALWFKAGSTSQSQTALLSRNGNSAGSQAAIIYEHTDNTVEFFSSGHTGTNPRTGSQMTIADTNWHHIAYTYDGTTWSGYLDGTSIFSNSVTFSLAQAARDGWYIGAANGTSGFVNGQIDEVFVYPRALSQTEVSNLMNGRYNYNDLTVRPGQALTYQATITNSHPSQSGTGFLTAEASYIDPALARPDVALSFEADQYISVLQNSVRGGKNILSCVNDGSCPSFHENGVPSIATSTYAIVFNEPNDSLTMNTLLAQNAGEEMQLDFWVWVLSSNVPASGQRAYLFDTAGNAPGALDVYLNDAGDIVFVQGNQQIFTQRIATNTWQKVTLVHNSSSPNTVPIMIGPGTIGNNLAGNAPFIGGFDQLSILAAPTVDRNTQQDILITFDDITQYDNSYFIDDDGNYTTATCTGTSCPTLVSDGLGKNGRAVSFDGNDILSYSPFVTDLSGIGTAKLSVRLDQLPATGQTATIFDSINSRTPGDRTIDLAINDAGNLLITGLAPGQVLTSNFSFASALGQWTEIEIRFGNVSPTYFRSIQLLVNGAVDSEHGGNTSTLFSFGAGQFGMMGDGSSPFVGAIDEINIDRGDGYGPTHEIGFDKIDDNWLQRVVQNPATGGGAATCIVPNCPAVDINGRFRHAFRFDGGNDTLLIENNGRFDVPHATWSAWVQPTWDASTQIGNPAVMALRSTTNTRASLHVSGDYSSIKTWNHTQVATYPATLVPNTWYHIAVVWDGSGETVYLNGSQIGNTPNRSWGSGSNLPLHIGSADGQVELFTGLIDEVVIVPESVNAAGVSALMNSVYPAITTPSFDTFTVSPRSNVTVSNTATVNNTAPEGAYGFSQYAEAALQSNLNYTSPHTNSGNNVHIPFDDVAGSTTFENLVNNQEATCPAGRCPVAGLPGQVNQAAYFDGINDRLQIDNISVGSNSTFAAWVNVEKGTIFDAYNSNGIVFRLSAGALETLGGSVTFDMPENEWVHVVVTRLDNNDNLHIVYLNGVEAARLNSTADPGSLSIVGIGGNLNGTNPLQGYLDEVLIIGWHLSPAEVLGLYQASGPVLRFTFDEEANATTFADASLYHHLGQPTVVSQTVTSPAPGVDGKLGNTATFDGRGAITVADHSSLDLNHLTMSLWISPDGPKNDWQTLIVKESNIAAERNYGLYLHPNSLRLHWIGHASDCVSMLPALNSPQSLPANTWSHVAVTFHGNVAIMYINGQQVSHQSYLNNPTLCQNNHPVKIGKEVSVLTGFEGQMDEVVLYGRAMNPSEVLYQYRRQLLSYSDRSVSHITVDTTAPTVTLVNSQQQHWANEYIALTVATADDSPVALVDFGLKGPGDSSFVWQAAPLCNSDSLVRTAWCPAFDPSLGAGAGTYELQFRAVDIVGNERTSAVYTIYVDNAPPVAGAGSSYNNTWLPVTIDTTGPLTATVALTTSVADGAGIEASGINTATVRMALIDRAGNIVGTGAPQAMDTITANGSNGWNGSINYHFQGELPGGTYTVTVSAEDAVGNTATFNWGTVRLDVRPPSIDIASRPINNAAITVDQPLSGYLIDQPMWAGAVGRFHLDDPMLSNTARPISGTLPFDLTCLHCPVPDAGIFGNGASFDGGNDILTGTSDTDLVENSNFTVSAWVNPGQNSFISPFVTLGVTNTVSLEMNVFGNLAANILTADSFRSVQDSVRLTTRQWQHVAVTYNGEALILYKDGVEVIRNEFTLTTLTDLRQVEIGGNSARGHYFNGYIDEVVIYDRALAGDEIFLLAEPNPSGVSQLDIWVEPINPDGSPSPESWQPITLAQPNASLSTWQHNLNVATLEGPHNIHFRGQDVQGNVMPARMVWHGVIDGMGPRVNLTATHTGQGASAMTNISFTVDDTYLDVPTLRHPCGASDVVQGFYGSTTHVNQLSGTCSFSGHQTGSYTVYACDLHARCGNRSVSLGADSVQIQSPSDGATLTSGVPVSISGQATSPTGIFDVTVNINGVFYSSYIAAFDPTSVNWNVPDWTPTAPGTYTIQAVVSSQEIQVATQTITVTVR